MRETGDILATSGTSGTSGVSGDFSFVGGKAQFHWFWAAMAVSSAIVFMLLTDSLHPPGGATALIAV